MKIGVDWGGTKIEAIAIDENGSEVNRIRVNSPKDNYQEIIKTVVDLIDKISQDSKDFTVGIGMPGSLHPDTGLVQVSNTFTKVDEKVSKISRKSKLPKITP